METSRLSDLQKRWSDTIAYCSNISTLQSGVTSNDGDHYCRSLIWKIFLVFNKSLEPKYWLEALRESRLWYEEQGLQHLQYIKHPERLSQISEDPLADDPGSPWFVYRQDEMLRAEIAQDVKRLPEDDFFQSNEELNELLMDVLFIYCKVHPIIGGYRQGMHELAAIILHTLHRDSIYSNDLDTEALSDDQNMEKVLDGKYLGHDTYTVFSRLMESAAIFYEVEASSDATVASSIVLRSARIHDELLETVDPELASHLRTIEILPQIFLIRWTRLLFSREFPIHQVLKFWDYWFVSDPKLTLVDWICVAMLLRVRWLLLDADYTTALALLLRYPEPDATCPPYTFIRDAQSLHDQPEAAGGRARAIILKYTHRDILNSDEISKSSLEVGKAEEKKPMVSSPSSSGGFRFAPPFSTLASRGKQQLQATAALSSRAKLLHQSGGLEALLQGAAKNVLEQGEKLGINTAFREVVGELRKNVQGLQDSQRLQATSRSIAKYEARDQELVPVLETVASSLRSLTDSDLQDTTKLKELLQATATSIGQVADALKQPAAVSADASDAVPTTSPPPTLANNVDPPLSDPQTSVISSTSSETLPQDSYIEETRPTVDVAKGVMESKPTPPPNQSPSNSSQPSAAPTPLSPARQAILQQARERNSFLFGSQDDDMDGDDFVKHTSSPKRKSSRATKGSSDTQNDNNSGELFSLEPLRSPKNSPAMNVLFE